MIRAFVQLAQELETKGRRSDAYAAICRARQIRERVERYSCQLDNQEHTVFVRLINALDESLSRLDLPTK